MTVLFRQATYWVGCDTENALEIFFDLAAVTCVYEKFNYIAAFDSEGQKLDEGKVEFYEENGEPYLNFAY